MAFYGRITNRYRDMYHSCLPGEASQQSTVSGCLLGLLKPRYMTWDYALTVEKSRDATYSQMLVKRVWNIQSLMLP